MADFVDDVWSELKALILATWTDLTVKRLWLEKQADQVNIVDYIEKAREGETGYETGALCAVVFGEVVDDPSWSLSISAKRIPLHVWRIERDNAANMLLNQSSKLYDLNAAIVDGSFTNFQAIERGSIDVSAGNQMNQALAAKQIKASAGCLYFSPGILCGES